MERKKVLLMEVKGVVGASAPQWISVSERLPECNQRVLLVASGINGSKICERPVLTGQLFNGVWFADSWEDWAHPDVTHWMPLPEPPKVGE